MSESRVLVTTKSYHRASRRRYHLPNPDDPTEPACRHSEADTEWVQTTADDLDERFTLCQRCDPEYEINVSHEGVQLSTLLERADPDDVSADSEMVRACPECDSTGIYRRFPKLRDDPDKWHAFYCDTCQTPFNEPVVREAHTTSTAGTSPLGTKLRNADPEDLGLSPMGSRGESATDNDDVDRGDGIRTDGGYNGAPDCSEFDYVVVRQLVSRGRVFHDPDPDTPDEPACGYSEREGVEWSRQGVETLPETWDRCKYCAGEVEPRGPHGDPWEVTKKLQAASPEDLGLSPEGERRAGRVGGDRSD